MKNALQIAASSKSTAGYNSIMRDEITYICPACGEEIVVPVDVTAGAEQDYVEDCPVCCRPNLLHVTIDDDGDATAWAESEQDEE